MGMWASIIPDDEVPDEPFDVARGEGDKIRVMLELDITSSHDDPYAERIYTLDEARALRDALNTCIRQVEDRHQRQTGYRHGYDDAIADENGRPNPIIWDE